MGYDDALRDGVRISARHKLNGYYPRWQFCGQELFSMSYRSDVRYTCDRCKPIKKLLLATGLFGSPKDERKCD